MSWGQCLYFFGVCHFLSYAVLFCLILSYFVTHRLVIRPRSRQRGHASGAPCSDSSHDRPVGRSRRSPPPKVSRGTGGCASSPTWRARLRRQVVCHMCCWMNSCSSLDIGPCDARPQAGRARSGPSSHSSYHLTSHHRTSSSYRQRRCIRSSSHHLINTSSHRSHHASHTPHLSPYADA